MLPRIKRYQLPSADGLPTGPATWRPDASRALLLVHDMQNYFVDAFDVADEPIRTVVANINLLRGECARCGIPVVFSAQPGGQTVAERGLLRDVWGDSMPADPRVVAIIDKLALADGETLLYKRRYSAFVGTRLAELLGARDQLLVTGVYGHIGVLTTALDAFCRDIQPFVVADAIGDFGPVQHEQTLRYVGQRCGRVLMTSDLLAAL